MRGIILLNGNLKIVAGNSDRSELAYACRQSYAKAKQEIADALLDRFTFIAPEAIGALTEAPILTNDPDYSEETMGVCNGPAPHTDASVWWFPNYMITDPWAELAHTGKVIFTKASD